MCQHRVVPPLCTFFGSACAFSRGLNPQGMPNPKPCLHRGKALLAYLDVEAGRLALSMPPAGSAGSSSSSRGSENSGGGGGISLNSLFSRVGSLGQALLGTDAGSSSSGRDGRSGGAAAQAASAAQALWPQLRAINWCPVRAIARTMCS